MSHRESLPSVVLICHEKDRLDVEGLASWLSSTMRLTGLILIRDSPARTWRAVRREVRHRGIVRFLDVLACRAYLRLAHAAAHETWIERTLARLRARFPANLTPVPRLIVANPNCREAEQFLLACEPDIVLARCKFILKPSVYQIARTGTFALHPGICPEYRNAHGCFWALVNRDLDRVGMTLLKIDAGVDTGPIYLHASCTVDELRESHIVIQYRVVLENLDAIGHTLMALHAGEPLAPLVVTGRRSATWRQPTLTDYLRWKWSARQDRRHANRHAAVS